MKHLLLSAFMSLAFTLVYAQKDVTTFLGIPVDGTKSEMMTKLKEKGFRYERQGDQFVGDFNGIESVIKIKTYNDKVWRITVADKNPLSETEVKLRFNNLCAQFDRKSDKYICAEESGFYIPEEENISYEMTVNNRRYNAYYYQVPNMELFDYDKCNQRIRSVLLRRFTPEQIDNPTEEEAKTIEELTRKEISKMSIELIEEKPVWFMIGKYLNMYYIRLFYDNEYNNNNNGADL